MLARTDRRVSGVNCSNTCYYVRDGLGSTMKTTDAAGAVVNAYTYDVYGTVTSSSGAQANEFQFAGEQTDPTGLQYLRARYYDTATGTFISRDPLSSGVGYSGHPFGYVGGNPVNLVDPAGEWGIIPPIINPTCWFLDCGEDDPPDSPCGEEQAPGTAPCLGPGPGIPLLDLDDIRLVGEYLVLGAAGTINLHNIKHRGGGKGPINEIKIKSNNPGRDAWKLFDGLRRQSGSQLRQNANKPDHWFFTKKDGTTVNFRIGKDGTPTVDFNARGAGPVKLKFKP